jgi:peptide/nickel transport system ATP-binding protein
MSDKIIDIRGLVVHYEMDEGVVEAVNNISFSINKGETLGLIGETGAGKTTVALSVLGLLPEKRAHVVQGEIIFGGENLLHKSNKQMQPVRGKKISMIFQDPMTALNPVKRIGEQIAEVLAIHRDRYDPTPPNVLAERLLGEVEIPAARYNAYPFEFSGGMKQRVVIAMALACRPEMIIADEPTTALDVTIQAQVLDLMKQLKVKYDTSMLLITHDFGVVAETCDRCAVMYAGEIVEEGSVEDIFDRPAHPYTVGLFNSLPKLGGGSADLKPIKGLMPDPAELPEHCTFADRCDLCQEKCRAGDPCTIQISPGHSVKCFRALSGSEAE